MASFTCSFCPNNNMQVEYMIAGDKSYICSECADEVTKILVEKRMASKLSYIVREKLMFETF